MDRKQGPRAVLKHFFHVESDEELAALIALKKDAPRKWVWRIPPLTLAKYEKLARGQGRELPRELWQFCHVSDDDRKDDAA